MEKDGSHPGANLLLLCLVPGQASLFDVPRPAPTSCSRNLKAIVIFSLLLLRTTIQAIWFPFLAFYCPKSAWRVSRTVQAALARFATVGGMLFGWSSTLGASTPRGHPLIRHLADCSANLIVELTNLKAGFAPCPRTGTHHPRETSFALRTVQYVAVSDLAMGDGLRSTWLRWNSLSWEMGFAPCRRIGTGFVCD